MNLNIRMVLPLTLIGAAVVLGGCVGAELIEGDDEAPLEAEASIDPEAEEAVAPGEVEAVGAAQQAAAITPTTRWECVWGLIPVGTVSIWWGHTQGDAAWACNNWISFCGNAGGCSAFGPLR
ncbi:MULTISPECIES: hypothetical protein [Sorangium]|uniref:Uncharacterized protein n=1 Tax=Sorangium cellulosum TaxID=56 RepID=A0A4P2R4A5_SORCE|nr:MULTISPECIES: hypothetical protein [Sorangium]AUX37897.1 uncharacterized protein SOCE836_101350 [Sorangium cellulosum]WCQ97184.1 hypothetical protein NQZ70_09975 [Sorangium sp. Soce836]